MYSSLLLVRCMANNIIKASSSSSADRYPGRLGWCLGGDIWPSPPSLGGGFPVRYIPTQCVHTLGHASFVTSIRKEGNSDCACVNIGASTISRVKYVHNVWTPLSIQEICDIAVFYSAKDYSILLSAFSAFCFQHFAFSIFVQPLCPFNVISPMSLLCLHECRIISLWLGWTYSTCCQQRTGNCSVQSSTAVLLWLILSWLTSQETVGTILSSPAPLGKTTHRRTVLRVLNTCRHQHIAFQK